jgi:hypothetical protein
MNPRSDQLLDRIGAAAGIAAVILLLLLSMASPALPPPNHPIGEIARSARVDADGILRSAYLGTLFSGALIVFGASVAARLRRTERAGGWWILALAGIAGTAVGVFSNALVITFVRAVAHGAGGDALWIAYPSGPDGVEIAVPLAIFFLGAGMGTRATGALPRWLAWLGVGMSALFVIGAGSVTGDEVDGGILGVPLFVGYVGLVIWIVAASVSMVRPRSATPEPAAVLT